MSLYFGWGSGVLWLFSSAAWLWSAATPSLVRKHPKGGKNAIEMFDQPSDGGWLSVNGLALPDTDQLLAYQRTVFIRNAIAAVLSAIAAILACAAIATARTSI